MIDKDLILEKLRKMPPEDVTDIVFASLNESGIELNSEMDGIVFYGLSQSDFAGTGEVAIAFSMFSVVGTTFSASQYATPSSEDFTNGLVELDYQKCVKKYDMASYVPAA